MRRTHRVLTGVGMAMAVSVAGPAAATAAAAPSPAAGIATTTTVTSSRASSSYDSRVTFTATVTAASGTPTGSVTFADVSNGSVLATENLVSGRASLTTAALAPGSRSVVARYRGDTTFNPSSSAALSFPVAASGSDAVVFQIDARHDGNQLRGPLTASSLTEKWGVDLNGDASSPLIARGRVFVMAGGMYALSAATGQTEWRDAYATGTLTYDGQEVFALTPGGTLTAYTASAGHKLWAVKLPVQATFTAPPTAYDGVVYVSGAGVGGTLYAVSEADGHIRWQRFVQNGDNSSPAVDDSGAYVSYSDHQDYRFTLSGRLVWNYAPSGEGGSGSTPVLHGNSVYTRGDPTFDSPIILSKASGKLTGAFATDSEPAFDSTSMYTLQDGNLVAVDPSGSPNRWTFAGQNLTTAPVISNGVVYAASISGTVYGVSAATGTQVWSGTAGDGDANGTGMAVGGGLLLVPAGSTLTAFGN